MVPFNASTFLLRYPEFAAIGADVLGLYWLEAGLYLRNDGWSIVRDTIKRAVILNMITAHIAELNNAASARGKEALVGRISDASEGSVKVTASMGPASANSAWWQQTKYGVAAWNAIQPYLSFRHVPCSQGW